MPNIEEITNQIKSVSSCFQPNVKDTPADDINLYYADSLAESGEDIQLKVDIKKPRDETKGSVLDIEYEILSENIDEALKKTNINFLQLEAMVFKIIMILMRRAAKVDQEYIGEMNIQIKAQAVKIQNTYNTWKSVTITVISATVSIAGAVGGFSTLFPAVFISPDVASKIASNSLNISNAGTSIGSIGSIFNNASEGERQVLQINLKRVQDKEEDRKGTKHGNNESRKSASESLKHLHQTAQETFRSMV